MGSAPLISTSELAAQLADPQLRVIDCRFDLAQPGWGEAEYQAGRIPGARYAHLDRDLSDLSQKATRGRHPLPTLTAFSASLSRLGINRQTRVVVYDQHQGMYAARLWWLLSACGHPAVQVLDGGYAAWLAAGLPLDSTPASVQAPTRLPEALVLQPGEVVEVDALCSALAAHNILLLDARAAPRFRGEVEPIDAVAGHVPGAHNRPFTVNLDAHGRFKPAAVLRAEFDALLVGRTPSSVVHMCGSGVTACHNRLAMDVAGLYGSRIYADSWSGWITDPARPIATD